MGEEGVHTPKSQQAILIKCIDNLHHVPGHRGCSNELGMVRVLVLVVTNVGYGLGVGPSINQRNIRGRYGKYRVFVVGQCSFLGGVKARELESFGKASVELFEDQQTGKAKNTRRLF